MGVINKDNNVIVDDIHQPASSNENIEKTHEIDHEASNTIRSKDELMIATAFSFQQEESLGRKMTT